MADTGSGHVVRTVNPATGEVIKEYAGATDEQTREIIDRAHNAYLTWRETPLKVRIDLCLRAAELAAERADAFGRQLSMEMGNPLARSKYEGLAAASVLRYYAEHAEEFLAPRPVETAAFKRAYVKPEATGIVLAIEPWNSPTMEHARASVPNLVLGNVMIMKPSPVTTGIALLFDEVLKDAGFPEGVYTTALLTNDQASMVIADPRVRGVTLTGSTRAGSAVAAQAGAAIKPSVLELGGSDAFIVLESADIDAAVACAVSCRLVLGGQACTSPKRIILLESIADRFLEGLVAGFEGQKVGDPQDPETTVGPLATIKGADDLGELYTDALDKGATVLVPGGRVEGPGAFFKPAVITDITPEMRVFAEEAFGPLAMVYRVPDVDAAVALANDSVYGLGGTVFGDVDDAVAVAERIDSGSVTVNGWLGGSVDVPFGGTKASGFGRELGPSAVDSFANLKLYAFH